MDKQAQEFLNEIKKIKAEAEETYKQAKSTSDYKSATDALRLRWETLLMSIEAGAMSQKLSDIPSYIDDGETPPVSKKHKTVLDD